MKMKKGAYIPEERARTEVWKGSGPRKPAVQECGTRMAPVDKEEEGHLLPNEGMNSEPWRDFGTEALVT